MGFLSDVGNAAAAGTSTIGNIVENGGNALLDTSEDSGAAVADAAEMVTGGVSDAGGATGNPVVAFIGAFVGGTVAGIVEAVRDIGHAINNLARDVLGIVGGLLRGDFGYAIERFLDIFIDLFDLALAVGRALTFGYLVGGVVKYTNRNRLRTFVEELLANTFTGATLDGIRERLGLTGVRWGFAIPATHERFLLDSATMDAGPTPLWSLHQSGAIDLYALAGLWSSDNPVNSVRVGWRDTENAVVFIVNPNGTDGLRANRFFLSHYINDAKHPGRLRVYAMSRRTVAERLEVASDKVETLGVNLSWNDGERFSWMRGYAAFELTSATDIAFSVKLRDSDRFLVAQVGRTGLAADDASPVALAVFGYAPQTDTFGWTAGREFPPSNQTCATPGRTDGCCNIIKRLDAGGNPLGAGVFHRDFWPNYGARYILAHELGHYLGLCHDGHHGVHKIMYTSAPAEGLSPLSAGLPLGYWLYSEPQFTFEDSLNAWRFIVHQMSASL